MELELDYRRAKKELLAESPSAWIPKLNTLYGWARKLDKAGGDARAVVAKFSDRGGRNQHRLVHMANAMLAQAIELLRKDKTLKLRPVELEKKVNTLLEEAVGPVKAPLILPSRATCSRALHNEFTEYEIVLRNEGKESADRFFRTWYKRDSATLPLEVVEFDDKDSGVFLVDEETDLPYGRGYVTAGVDQRTRMPLGFSTSELHRSTWSALQCFTNSILPKDMSLDEFALVQKYELPWGKAGIAVFDNATYNHSSDISASCHEANVIPAWSKPYTPTEKSLIENFNGRMKDGVFALLGGFRGDKKLRDGLKQGQESAVEDIGLFRRLLMKWAYGVFANDPGESGVTVWQGWHALMSGVRRRYPLDIFRLRLAPTLRHTVQLRPEGVRFTGLIYSNDRLKKLQKDIGYRAEIVFRYNPGDMGCVYVFDPHLRVYFEVPSTDPAYTTGLTLYQHKLVRKMCRIRSKRNPSIADMLAELEELRKLVAQNKRSKRMRERSKARRAQGSASPGGDKASQPTEPIVVTVLEDTLQDLFDTEMEVQDEGWEMPEPV